MNTRRRASALVDEAYTALGEAIVDGRLQPGDRLRDVELAELMGISRTPVREALQKLERIGLVEVAANRYTRVAALSDRARIDMREYAAHTIAGALRVAVPRLDETQVEVALTHIGAMRDAQTSRAYVVAVLALYRHMVAGSRNIVFSRALDQTDLVLRRNLEGWRSIEDDTREALFTHLGTQIAQRDANGATWTFLALHGFA
ncbi:GntR family transcriptional regulator [Microbacterium trichothecenolyticum]|uniref:DNA-binding GntR family transcriptional regulator n=1 Tax=Microbacterium trichothecenolyticum TaxID=69370 RepID=A0ABU0TW76_MICTR|nr:GntR family transcriptional regulator [Microbacterium trichothecenolyticum]MDQ1123912.1 DNA-binding GntR family transcriptional regulator [Microbacterium trichothecenolyticum]